MVIISDKEYAVKNIINISILIRLLVTIHLLLMIEAKIITVLIFILFLSIKEVATNLAITTTITNIHLGSCGLYFIMILIIHTGKIFCHVIIIKKDFVFSFIFSNN